MNACDEPAPVYAFVLDTLVQDPATCGFAVRCGITEAVYGFQNVEIIAAGTIRKQSDGQWYYNTVAVADKEMRPGSYESPGAHTRSLGKTPITGLDEFIRRDLKRVNPESFQGKLDAKGEPLPAEVDRWLAGRKPGAAGVGESPTPYQGFRLRPAGATRYVHSSTGVLFADGHEIKTAAAAPGEIPAGGGMLWDRLRETSRRGALLDTWQAGHDDPAFTGWLTDMLDRAPGADVRGSSVKSFWHWLKATLNGPNGRGYDPLDVMDALSGIGVTGPVASEHANPDRRLHYAPIDDTGTVLWAEP